MFVAPSSMLQLVENQLGVVCNKFVSADRPTSPNTDLEFKNSVVVTAREASEDSFGGNPLAVDEVLDLSNVEGQFVEVYKSLQSNVIDLSNCWPISK